MAKFSRLDFSLELRDDHDLDLLPHLGLGGTVRPTEMTLDLA